MLTYELTRKKTNVMTSTTHSKRQEIERIRKKTRYQKKLENENTVKEMENGNASKEFENKNTAKRSDMEKVRNILKHGLNSSIKKTAEQSDMDKVRKILKQGLKSTKRTAEQSDMDKVRKILKHGLKSRNKRKKAKLLQRRKEEKGESVLDHVYSRFFFGYKKCH